MEMATAETAKAIKRPRRVLFLQRRTVSGGGARSIFYLALPKDLALRMGLSKGDRFRVHEIGGVLAYERLGEAE